MSRAKGGILLRGACGALETDFPLGEKLGMAQASIHSSLEKTVKEATLLPFAKLQKEGGAERLACDSGAARENLASL